MSSAKVNIYRKKLLYITFLIIFITPVLFSNLPKNRKYEVGVLLDGGRSSPIARHIYKNLSVVFKHKGYNINLTFLPLLFSNVDVLSVYDAVVVINDNNSSNFNMEVNNFFKANKNHRKIDNAILVVVFPKNERRQNFEKFGINVLSTASQKGPAATFVRNTLSKEILWVLENQYGSAKIIEE